MTDMAAAILSTPVDIQQIARAAICNKVYQSDKKDCQSLN
jgi:hypothetical protein